MPTTITLSIGQVLSCQRRSKASLSCSQPCLCKTLQAPLWTWWFWLMMRKGCTRDNHASLKAMLVGNSAQWVTNWLYLECRATSVAKTFLCSFVMASLSQPLCLSWKYENLCSAKALPSKASRDASIATLSCFSTKPGDLHLYPFFYPISSPSHVAHKASVE